MVGSTPTVAETVKAVAEGHLTARQWTQHCLDRINSHEDIAAWSFVDKERALEKADALDWMRQDGSAFGPLHGCPVGLKDIIEVKGDASWLRVASDG